MGELLPGEQARWSPAVGEQCWYVRIGRGGYGFASRVPVIVTAVKKRIRVEWSGGESWVSLRQLRQKET